MKREKVILKKLNSLAKTPVYSSDFAAGADLYAATDSDILIAPDQTVMVARELPFKFPMDLWDLFMRGADLLQSAELLLQIRSE